MSQERGTGPVRKVILVTDGDRIAQEVIEQVAKEFGARCISRSAGNPTPLTGEQLVHLIMKAKHDPVFVLFDDNGHKGSGAGEQALEYVATHPNIRVLGALAVASNTELVEGARVDLAVDGLGNITYSSVNKYGDVEAGEELCIYGDTVGVLNRLNIPIIVGIGDIGKMNGKDHLYYGAPITKKAVELILKRHGYLKKT